MAANDDAFDGVTPDIIRAAEKRAAAIARDRGEATDAADDESTEEPKKTKSRRQTTRG